MQRRQQKAVQKAGQNTQTAHSFSTEFSRRDDSSEESQRVSVFVDRLAHNVEVSLSPSREISAKQRRRSVIPEARSARSWLRCRR
jgi:hypothetical protein